MVVNFNNYKIEKQFQLINSLILEIVQIKLKVKALSTGKIDYCEYLANAPAGVDTNLLSLLLAQQNQRTHVLIGLMKKETYLKKVLREISRELGDLCRCEGSD